MLRSDNSTVSFLVAPFRRARLGLRPVCRPGAQHELAQLAEPQHGTTHADADRPLLQVQRCCSEGNIEPDEMNNRHLQQR